MAEKVCCSYRNVLSTEALEKELIRVSQGKPFRVGKVLTFGESE